MSSKSRNQPRSAHCISLIDRLRLASFSMIEGTGFWDWKLHKMLTLRCMNWWSRTAWTWLALQWLLYLFHLRICNLHKKRSYSFRLENMASLLSGYCSCVDWSQSGLKHIRTWKHSASCCARACHSRVLLGSLYGSVGWAFLYSIWSDAVFSKGSAIFDSNQRPLYCSDSFQQQLHRDWALEQFWR